MIQPALPPAAKSSASSLGAASHPGSLSTGVGHPASSFGFEMAGPSLDFLAAVRAGQTAFRFFDTSPSGLTPMELFNLFMENGLMTRSPRMLPVLRIILKVAQLGYPVPVIIQGESGTGKEIVARFLHRNSVRSEKPFVVVNCGAIPENLIESELFGHAKGAFTGADHRQNGLVAAAHEGILFLDEVEALPLAAQVKLLRVIQTKDYTPIGDSQPRHSDFQLLAATNRSLLEEIKAGRFREDFFYRLNVISINLPPLRERMEDIPFLVGSFLRQFQNATPSCPSVSVEEGFLAGLMKYSWPGNVRELHNILERGFVLCENNALTFADLPEILRVANPSFPVDWATINLDRMAAKEISRRELELRYLHAVLKTCGFSHLRAAEIMQIDRRTAAKMIPELEALIGEKMPVDSDAT
jgi:DNA-binding NtrC family response regulator